MPTENEQSTNDSNSTSSEQDSQTQTQTPLESQNQNQNKSPTLDDSKDSLLSSEDDNTKLADDKDDKSSQTDDDKSAKDDGEAISFDKLEVPETIDTETDAAKSFMETVNDPNLSRAELAQKMVDMFASEADKMAEQQLNAWTDLNSKWQNELVEEFGEERLVKELGNVKSFINEYALAIASSDRGLKSDSEREAKAAEIGEELKSNFNLTGGGNNPAIVKLLMWAAKQSGEGQPLDGGPPDASRSRADRMFNST